MRDPVRSSKPLHAELEPAARPLTRAAALAIAARTKTTEVERRGVVPGPYRGYRGDEVIGVWQWLPAYDFGVIAEISATEAFATLRYLSISFAVLGGLTALSLVAALLAGFTLWRLQRQSGKLQRLGAYTLERQVSDGDGDHFTSRGTHCSDADGDQDTEETHCDRRVLHRLSAKCTCYQLCIQTRAIYDLGRTREGQPYYVWNILTVSRWPSWLAHSAECTSPRDSCPAPVAAALREAHCEGCFPRCKPDTNFSAA